MLWLTLATPFVNSPMKEALPGSLTSKTRVTVVFTPAFSSSSSPR
jgi:hypothetical protein